MADCRYVATSEEYADFIVNWTGSNEEAVNNFDVDCFQRISGIYGTVFRPLRDVRALSLRNYRFNEIPALYGLMERDIRVRSSDLQSALDVSGIISLQRQPTLQLKGQGCIMAFIDTGINIDDDEFRFGNGDTRILRLWDMTDETGRPPEGIVFGSEYNTDDINNILKENGRPGRDEIGHGNYLARIGAGKSGAVPESQIVVVKLKPAKAYLREYYHIESDAVAYQENDIMLAVNYVRSVAQEYKMPVSLCLALGTNGRSHDGRSALSFILDTFVSDTGAVISVVGGDEGNKQLHSSGNIDIDNEPVNVELRVAEGQDGLMINIWGDEAEVLSVGLISPTGEVVPRIPVRVGKSETYNLVFDRTTVVIEYDLVEGDSGDELILINLMNPTAGVWTIQIYGENILTGRYNVYLPISQFLKDETYFLSPDPEITLTDPAYARYAITSVGFEPDDGALYLENGRGFARDNAIKPDIATPLSVAITAGASCQFLNWGIVNGNDTQLRSSDIKSYLIRGAIRRDNITYPSREWGFGSLDVYRSFERLRGQ